MSLLGFITGRDAGHDRTSIWDDMDNYSKSNPRAEEKKYYCKYCGEGFRSLSDMKKYNFDCRKSPFGFRKGPHEPYEGR